MSETIIQFSLQDLKTNSFGLVATIVSVGYQKTGRKFWVDFNGSKGYLSNISISCEFQKSTENIIMIECLVKPNGELQNKTVSVNYSASDGISLELS